MTNDFKEQLLNYLTGTIQRNKPPGYPTLLYRKKKHYK